MRNMLALIFFGSIINFQIHTMETPPEEKTWLWEIFHLVDQWTDPLSYFTDKDAPKVCSQVMRFGLSEKDDKFREFTGDTNCLEDIKSAFKRQRALITSLEAECLKDGDSKVELFRDVYQRQSGYFSQNVLSLIESYLERAGKNAHNTAYILDQQAGKILEPAALPAHLAAVTVIEESRAVTHQTIVNLVMGTSWLSWENGINNIRKRWTDPLKYLIDEKAQNIAHAMRHLHPRHKFHSEQWTFNNKLEFHKRLIHQALERERRLSQALQVALEKDKSWMIVALNPENPDNKMVMDNIRSCYPPLACAAIKGYLLAKANEKQRALDAAKQKEQDAKELEAKNKEVSSLLSSLARKFSDANNKTKLSETQRSAYTEMRNTLIGRPTAMNLQEVRDAHALLSNLSKEVENLLQASSANSPSPSLTNSGASLPPYIPTAPELKPAAKTPPAQNSSIQSVVDTAHMSGAAVSATPSAIHQTQLSPVPTTPTHLTPEPPTPPTESSHSAPAIDATAAKSSKESSPQASPPQTPEGSLVVAASNSLEKTNDEEFNPRAENVVNPPTNPAQAKLAAAFTPAPAKQQTVPKNGNGKKRN